MISAQLLYQVSGLNFSYPGSSPALQGINLEVYQGEFLVLLGINGSGKTTLLGLLCRLLEPLEGEVKLYGKELSRYYGDQELYQLVNLVFQEPNDQLFCTTVEEDVSFGPRNLGLEEAEIERRVSTVLKNVGLEGFRHRCIHELSFGEKKRTALACALAMGSKTLLLDEPTSGIDPVGASEIFQMLREYNRQQDMTVIMATQDVDMIPVYASRVALLSKGELITVAPVKELFENPQLLRESRVRLPRVAHLMEVLEQEEGVGSKPYPLTIGEARRQLVDIMKNKGLENR